MFNLKTFAFPHKPSPEACFQGLVLSALHEKDRVPEETPDLGLGDYSVRENLDHLTLEKVPGGWVFNLSFKLIVGNEIDCITSCFFADASAGNVDEIYNDFYVTLGTLDIVYAMLEKEFAACGLAPSEALTEIPEQFHDLNARDEEWAQLLHYYPAIIELLRSEIVEPAPWSVAGLPDGTGAWLLPPPEVERSSFGDPSSCKPLSSAAQKKPLILQNSFRLNQTIRPSLYDPYNKRPTR
jgi:hypothetical protein